MRLMPCSTAARMVAMDSASSVPPHIQPPMAQVPRIDQRCTGPFPVLQRLRYRSPARSSRSLANLTIARSGACCALR